MSDIIHLLPDSVANQIAAGEVIQRPASVVKELVENSVDAGATDIEVIIEDAGRTLIQVVDNGKGMSETDARMAFERHATSKILRADDLFALHTMGFRGEALASICAVAQIELRTRRADDEVGTRLVISGSKVEEHAPVACGQGTNLMVKNLFFNVPARRKFLKKDAVEFANIAREFERMALVNPGVALTLIHNSTIVHRLMQGTLKQRISDLFGKSVERQLVPVETATSLVKISGFVGMPEHARQRNTLQYFMVNGRHMRHPYFHKAVMHCYESLIAADRQPNYFINFTVDPSTIDVNIHPTKNEIKFENEAAIWQILVAAVREGLGRWGGMPSIDFDNSAEIEIPVFNPNENGSHSVDVDTTYNPFNAGSASKPKSKGITDDWELLYSSFMSSAGQSAEKTPATREVESSIDTATKDSSLWQMDTEDTIANNQELVADHSTAPLQVSLRYLICEATSGVMVVDQHRAHVKVLYERYRDTLASGNPSEQQVLFPEVIELSASKANALKAILPHIRSLGFDLSFLGQNAWSIVAVPAMLSQQSNAAEILRHIVDDAEENIERTTNEIIDRTALSMARSAAIRAGQRLSPHEREQLIADLMRLPSPNYTPDGLPVIKIIPDTNLKAMF